MPQTVTLAIDGMHCDGCVRRVTAALEKLAGAGKAQVEVGSAVVTIESDQPPSEALAQELLAQQRAEEMVDALQRIGFPARLV
jgi:Cu+-exporting ATPase